MDEKQRLTSISGATGNDSLSPLSSSVHSGSSQSSQAGSIPPYSNPHCGRQQLYPPSGNAFGSRSFQSHATGDGLMARPYNHIGPTSPSTVPGGSSTHSSMLSQSSHHTPISSNILSFPSAASEAPSSSATISTDAYSRPPTTSSYYAPPSSTPQRSSFSSFANSHHSPTQSSPTTTGSISRAIPPLNSHHSMHAPTHYSNHHYGGYSALAPPVSGNMENPSAPPILVGAMNTMAHGYPPHLSHHHMYSRGQSAHQERPFQCDVCPKSFNRNHDLKRHKRIHLAVKPFPCDHCDKSFSRKDALKRHTLVKGCGNGKSSPIENSSPHREMKPDPDGNGDNTGVTIERKGLCSPRDGPVLMNKFLI
ncbi:Zinc finger protein [Apiospora kogelbergensis]|uniref:Zinc finger protein n=1 Tax=Apiospora kogelbergensis TaxID=1337665 RepID=A0AAW0QU92_9PEZI